MDVSTDLFHCDDALTFLYDRINYERTLAVPYNSGSFKLDRMRELLARLGDPHHRLPVVHVAGTKGKGSTAAMIAAMLTAAGYRTGLYTSPHLDRLEQRLAVDGLPCSPAELVELADRVRPVVRDLDRLARLRGRQAGPTYFETITAMALDHFARRQVDVAVVEVGLGGRLDSTNVCRPLVSVITSISYDHMRQLGNTLASIAREKAGIIKPGVPVVSGVCQQPPRQVIEQIANGRDCELFVLGRDFQFTYHPPRALDVAARAQDNGSPALGTLDYCECFPLDRFCLKNLSLSLLGHHQAANAAVALATLRRLPAPSFLIAEEAIRRGLSKVSWPGRVELIGQQPTVVIDAAHNVASIEALLRTLDESFLAPRRLLVFATTQDKDVRGMLRLLLPRFEWIIFTRYQNNPRGVPPGELAREARQLRSEQGGIQQAEPVHWTVCPDPAAAVQQVHALTTPEHLICVTGSFFIAAEMRTLLRGPSTLPPAMSYTARRCTLPV